jgi:hypothetical protein
MLTRDYIQAKETVIDTVIDTIREETGVLKSLIDYLSGAGKQLLQIPKDFNKIFKKVMYAWNHEGLPTALNNL